MASRAVIRRVRGDANDDDDDERMAAIMAIVLVGMDGRSSE